MKRWGTLKPLRLDEKEMKTDLGKGNFIFVGSSTDMFADGEVNPANYPFVERVLDRMWAFSENKYLLQSKDPWAFDGEMWRFPDNTVFCTTIETNRWYPEIMNNSPSPEYRAWGMGRSAQVGHKNYVTIEPIMDFDLPEMVDLIRECNPVQVNIGADSGNNHLPEPTMDKLLQLVEELERFAVVYQKKNLGRLLK
jgi:hypothetical protein